MTMQQLSEQYTVQALAIQQRLTQLRLQNRHSADPQQQFQLQQRIRALQPMLTECHALAQVTGHYYDKGYHHESYTF